MRRLLYKQAPSVKIRKVQLNIFYLRLQCYQHIRHGHSAADKMCRIVKNYIIFYKIVAVVPILSINKLTR